MFSVWRGVTFLGGIFVAIICVCVYIGSMTELGWFFVKLFLNCVSWCIFFLKRILCWLFPNTSKAAFCCCCFLSHCFFLFSFLLHKNIHTTIGLCYIHNNTIYAFIKTSLSPYLLRWALSDLSLHPNLNAIWIKTRCQINWWWYMITYMHGTVWLLFYTRLSSNWPPTN